MAVTDDPTLGELVQAGRLSVNVALLFERVLGDGWRGYRRSEAERRLLANDSWRREAL